MALAHLYQKNMGSKKIWEFSIFLLRNFLQTLYALTHLLYEYRPKLPQNLCFWKNCLFGIKKLYLPKNKSCSKHLQELFVLAVLTILVLLVVTVVTAVIVVHVLLLLHWLRQRTVALASFTFVTLRYKKISPKLVLNCLSHKGGLFSVKIISKI